jgi:hypothetical protein
LGAVMTLSAEAGVARPMPAIDLSKLVADAHHWKIG